jgi:signal peptidase I
MLRPTKPTTLSGAAVELVFVVVVAIGLALGVQAAVAKPYQIPSASMLPTLEVGQRVLVDRVSYRFADPQVGDIVVFHPPVGAAPGHEGPMCGVEANPNQACPTELAGETDENFIKRIVAGPGDRLRIEDGHTVVNGAVAEEDFILPCGGVPQCNLTEEITIPEGHYFMMGDNRGASQDSRFWGPVPRDAIIGKALVTYWPPDRIGPF